MKSMLMMLVVLVVAVSAQAVFVPNGDFETMYKPGSTTVTAGILDGQWSMGVGPDCPIDGGDAFQYSDGTIGTTANITGWIGYDVDAWITAGGTYERPLVGNYQGNISLKEGSYVFGSNGGGWGNPNGGLITSDASLGSLTSGVYTLSVMVYGVGGGAHPVVLDLLLNGVALVPDSSIVPVLTDQWQELSKTYDLTGNAGILGQDMTIALGVDRGSVGPQTRFDNVTLVPEPATMLLLGLGGLSLIRRRRNS